MKFKLPKFKSPISKIDNAAYDIYDEVNTIRIDTETDEEYEFRMWRKKQYLDVLNGHQLDAHKQKK